MKNTQTGGEGIGMKKGIKRTITMLMLIAIIITSMVTAFAENTFNAIDNTSSLVIVDSYTGNIVQNAESVNSIINLIGQCKVNMKE